MNRTHFHGIFIFFFLFAIPATAQKNIIYKDSVVKRVVYKDTIVYKYDTITVKHYVHSDTVWAPVLKTPSITPPKKRGIINPNSWGIGPSLGLYYSPFHGADINIGFGVQYYFLAIPSFRNPHMGHHRRKK